MAQMERGESIVTVKITADVDEAVAGLKRLQRVARETVKEIRELESAANGMREVESLTIFTSPTRRRFDLSNVLTKELIDELARRVGVSTFEVGPDGDVTVNEEVSFNGPAKVIVVKD